MVLKDDADTGGISERIFVNEDLSRPENRINVALFGLMAQDWFRTWLLFSLGMPENAIVFPPTNVGAQRPDFTIEDPDTGETFGWIEVEVGSDEGQLHRYAESFEEEFGREGCVKSIWGRGGDLSLVCISSRLESKLDAGTLAPQPGLSVRLLHKLIEQALGEAGSTSKPVPVSEQMKDHWLVQALNNRLGDRLDFDLKPAVPGCLKANARGERGFSLRVYSPSASGREVSVLNIRGGAEEVCFASRAHLERYLAEHRAEAISAWCNMVQKIGEKGSNIDVMSVTRVPVRVREQALDEHEAEFAECLVALSRAA